MCALAAFSIGAAEPVYADGNRLLERCQHLVRLLDANPTDPTSPQEFPIGWCTGYVEAISHMLIAYKASLGHIVCIPSGVMSNKQFARITVRYLTEHPEELHEIDLLLILRALQQAFPCETDEN